MSEVVKGFKAFDKNLKCRDMQYEVGKEYKISKSPIICERGFHFCKNILEVYDYYELSKDTRVCEIEAYGDIITNDNHKFCTNKIRILKEIENPMDATNSGTNNAGIGNAGSDNVGDLNSGYNNLGNENAGYNNLGRNNSGGYNSGDFNSGYYNLGSTNTGNGNIGNHNSGHCNSGRSNSGNYNLGNDNSGDYNSGNFNSGFWNLGNCNTGVFNTDENPKIKMFDADSDWTLDDWKKSSARRIMSDCPNTFTKFIDECNMSDEEKEYHPQYKVIGGYVKMVTVSNTEKQAWWDELPDDCKQIIFDLPNFNAEKFKACTGIDVSKK